MSTDHKTVEAALSVAMQGYADYNGHLQDYYAMADGFADGFYAGHAAAIEAHEAAKGEEDYDV